ncbi:autotransporter-associated beta strand repeat-containing protein [Haloferula sp. BvORR071]|uniref:autotransporter-associated beta strand repeat-containing protein n=1 Tax=Haloferula sp. BvORR071 TaxID=1396141 RepID=UPI00054F89D0|nr:autotransporter-associated beta strand repeat-containing protein [Haloferula sp. BvORR071]
MYQPKFRTVCRYLGVSARISIGAAIFATPALAGNLWVGGTVGAEQDWNDIGNWGGAFPVGNTSVNVATGNFPIITATPSFTPVDLLVGTAGASGRLDQRAGTVATGNGNWLFVGQGNAGNGTYNLADTSLTTGPAIGSLTGFGVGSGSINAGGTSTTGGRLVVGDAGSSVGNFNMNTSGTLKTEEDAIGIILGNGGTSTGNFKLDGGTVQVNSLATTGIGMLVGTNGGDGNFRMSGGTVTVTGGIWAGDNNVGSQGLFEVSGGNFSATASGTNAQNGQHAIGRGLGQGTLNVSGTGNVSLTGLTHVGYSGTATAGTTGIVNVTGGSFTNTGELRVGSGLYNNGAVISAGSGTLNVSAGSATVTGNLKIASGNDSSDVVTGTANISGTGTLNAAGDLILGYAGNSNLGKLVISENATVNVGTSAERWLIVSQYDTAKGQLDISGGNLRLLNNSDIRFTTGNTSTNSTNVINQTGGAVTSYADGTGTTLGGSGVLDMQYSGAAGVNNTYNLNGGTLTLSGVGSTLATGTRTFNFNGGTLRATTATANFMSLGAGNARANVRDGGAIIDTNGVDITIGQSLSHSNISGDNAVDGGLTKNGGGKLTLTTTSNYTGATTVNGGTLSVNGNIATSSLTTVNSGGTLAGTGTVGALTVGSGGFLTPGNSAGILNTGSVNLQSGAQMGIEVLGATAGSGYDQLNVTGSVTLAGLLNVTSSFTPTEGNLFFIVLNDETDAINGTFSGLANNSIFNAGGQLYQISYFGDSGTNSFTGGNDGVLMAVPEPGALFLGTIGMLGLLRRRRAA